MDLHATKPLGRWGKFALALFLVFLIAFGVLVEIRSTFLDRRMGDLDVFLRAAWAVRNGADLYAVTSDNDWHYLYPPLYAILLTPLADPPGGAEQTGYLPYPASVAIVFFLSLGSLCAGAHVLASALEASADDASFRTQPRYCLRWWALRSWPVVICLLPIAHTLMRGQANVIVLAILCAALAGWLRGHNFRAGLWLALAICIKVIPAFLVLYPLWKRDGRGLLGCAAGLFVGLIVVPAAVFGPAKTVCHYETYGHVFFAPFLGMSADDSRNNEILGGVNATESIGVRNALHNWLFPERSYRPRDMHALAQGAYLLFGFAMTWLTLWPRSGTNAHMGHTFGALIVLMAIFSPVCHSHYLLFCAPIVMSLLASAWQDQATIRVPWQWTAIFAVFFLTVGIAYLPGLEILKDRCASLFATLPLWGMPIAQLWRAERDIRRPYALREEIHDAPPFSARPERPAA